MLEQNKRRTISEEADDNAREFYQIQQGQSSRNSFEETRSGNFVKISDRPATKLAETG